jgi:integrase/recombinase XerD
MKTQIRRFSFSLSKARKAIDRHLMQYKNCCDVWIRVKSASIRNFLSFIASSDAKARGDIVISELIIKKWMIRIAREPISVLSSINKISSVDAFLEMLTSDLIIPVNPIRCIKERFAGRGWVGIVLALRSPYPNRALNTLRPKSLFTGRFGNLAEEYLLFQQSIGKPYAKKLVLAEFNRFLNKHSIDSMNDIKESTIARWIDSMTCSNNACRSKLSVLSQFFDYARSMEIVAHNPVSDSILNSFRYSRRPFKPYIYSHDEIGRLLESSKKLTCYPRFVLKPHVLHMTISLLYALGLRIGEALKLTIRDIDLHQKTLFIRDSKFYKDRLLPFGPKLGKCLEAYMDLRRKYFKPVKKDDPLLVATTCTVIRKRLIQQTFGDILKDAGIVAPPGQRRPRLHDFRHTFAVHRLLRWYEEGVNVQDKLPLLSTFMGHVNIYSTQVYLTITDSLLREASNRFHNQFGMGFDKRRSL